MIERVLALAALAIAVIPTLSDEPHVVGHRGAPAALPENTLAGFAYALDHGAQAVELDVRITADDVAVVAHDAVLPDRCVGPRGWSRRIAQLRFDQLQQFDCGAPDPAFPKQRPSPGARVPKLVDVLALVRDKQRLVLVELKADDAPVAPKFARLVAHAVEEAGAQRCVVIESFDLDLLRAISIARPDLRRGLLVGDDVDDAPARAEALGCVVLSPAAKRVTRSLVDDARARRVVVVPWTVNDDATWSKLAALHVFAVVTDDPAHFASRSP